MSFVRTVQGDISPEDLGWCGAHEHIVIAPSYATEKFPQYRLEEVEPISEELGRFRAAGGRSMVDAMPCDCGRDVIRLTEVSRRSGVQIVAPTGAHLAKYYPPGHWSGTLTEAQLADLFIADIEEGIDRHDYGAPIVERTAHRAGVIKVATAGEKPDDREERLFRAAARAHRSTGCPILTHTEEGGGGQAQLDLLESSGVDPGHVVLSHLDRNPDPHEHRILLKRGARLEYDSAFRWKGESNPTLVRILELAPEFPDGLVLGMDAARRSYWRAFGGGPGLDFLPAVFAPRLRQAGLSDDLIERLFIRNPAAAFAFTSNPIREEK